MNESVQKSGEVVKTPNRNPYTPWFVVIAFVAPVALSYGLYFLGVSPPGYSNRGELLQPVLDVDNLVLKDDAGETLSRETITQRKWQLLYFAGSQCDEKCNFVLLNLRQINTAVGKNQNRLRRMIVHLEPAEAAFSELVEREFPEVRHAHAERNTVLASLAATSPDLGAHEVYLVDPLGNVMMRFRMGPELGFKDVLHDLNKLFKVSQIG